MGQKLTHIRPSALKDGVGFEPTASARNLDSIHIKRSGPCVALPPSYPSVTPCRIVRRFGGRCDRVAGVSRSFFLLNVSRAVETKKPYKDPHGSLVPPAIRTCRCRRVPTPASARHWIRRVRNSSSGRPSRVRLRASLRPSPRPPFLPCRPSRPSS